MIGILAVLVLSTVALASDNTPSPPAAKTEAANAAATTNTPNAAPAVGVNPMADPPAATARGQGRAHCRRSQRVGWLRAPELRDRLLLLLKDKGVLSAEDLNSLKPPTAAATSMDATMSPSVAL